MESNALTETEKLLVELNHKKQELDLQEKNLHTMRELSYMEHQTQTQTIRRITMQVIQELESKGHTCVNGERITRIEEQGKATYAIVKETREAQKEIMAHVDVLFAGRNENQQRLTVLETEKKTGLAIICAIGAGIMSFLTLVVAIWAIMESRREVREIKASSIIPPTVHIAKFNGIEETK